MWELLNEIKALIATIPEIETVKIGAETGISAKDCPAVRIITEYASPLKANGTYDEGSLQIVLLINSKNDLESLYEQSIALELLIRASLKNKLRFTRVDYDQDSVTVFKASILHFDIVSVPNGSTCE